MKFLYSIVCSFLFLATVSAQKGTVRGNIFDKDTGEPVIYANVYLDGTTTGTNSDVNGFFTLTDVAVGEYILVASFIGFDTVRSEVVIKNNRIENKNLFMSENSVRLQSVNISARRERSRSEVQVSTVSISPREIKALPSAGGEPDIAQYLQILPGVVSTGDQGGQIYIRGGSPVQNKILLDGLTIYNPFHSIGFFSIFETDIIKNVDVLSGGFSAEHGGRVSAVVDIQTRDGNKKELGGSVSLSPFLAKVVLEGPLATFDEDSGNSASFILTSKKSLINNTSPTLYEYALDDPEQGFPFDFRDTYGKVSINTSTGSNFNFFGFNFTDDYNNPALANISWTNNGGGLNFRLIPAKSNLVMGGTLGVSNYGISLIEDNDPRTSDIREILGAFDFTFYGSSSEFNYGIEIRSVRTEFEFTNPFNIKIDNTQNTTELATYFKFKQNFSNKVIFQPSVRFHYYASQSNLSIEPRLGLKYNITEDLRFKAAAGVYTQNILSTSNERDVVNLFSGFLTGPESQVFGFDGKKLEDKLQKSSHLIAGFEYNFTDNFEINIEGYFKDFPQLIVLNRNKTSNTDPNYAVETGDAYGIDFTAKYTLPRAYFYATYSHGYVNRFDGEQEYPTVFDRRHNSNLLATIDVDEAGTWQVSARWNLGSGFPFTQTQGFYNFINLLGGVDTDVVTANPDDVGIIYSEERNGGRLPFYHRLDLSVKKKLEISNLFGLEITAAVTNAYNRDNIFFFDRVEYERQDQLPIIPSISVKGIF
ncbi:MAG TPA: TonB-dependent receptor [Saprospirales bacterium]|nr:TonB-dependent receptor [Saprospirales bacterium]